MKKKNKYGQYFTIDDIAKFMVNLIQHNKDARVLEPSSGKGVFLKNLENEGFTNISAYEIDNSIGNEYNYIKYQSFISSPLDPYDVVIGNPPYIRWKNLEPELKDELATSYLWNKYFNSLCDYHYIFILKSIEQLTEGGELIFICTEYWMNTTHSESLREYMVNNGYISDMYHFKEANLFEDVCASFIIFRYVKSNNKAKNISLYKYKQTNTPSYEELISHTCFERIIIPQFESGKRWLLATKEEQKQLYTFELKCRKESTDLFIKGSLDRIGDICDIGNGMVSGLDKAFNVSSLDETTEYEKSHIINVLKAKDLGHYVYSSESRYFFINDSINEDEFERLCPNVYRHMISYKEDLNKRYKYGKDTNYWEFVFPRNFKLFSRKEPRIMVPCKERISNKNYFRFVLASHDYSPLQDVTCLLKKKHCRESIEYLTAYLNDHRVFNWLRYNGIVKGAIVEFSETPIASIPYRKINWEDPKEVEAHNIITTSLQQYIQTKSDKYLNEINKQFDYLFV
ncbi:MAG: N-6 DNA methylase [Bacteroidaceae bacterium]|nr:N-6 DNA methylase [Bacteroidaceae bacterium]